MPIYKYTVANKQGKRLSGNVEAPDETIARSELNNLGFSILSLQETKEQLPEQSSIPKFIFEALDKQNRKITGTIPAETKEQAQEKLQLQYNVTVTALWQENATPEEITAARAEASLTNLNQINLTQNHQSQTQNDPQTPSEEQKRLKFTQNKIDHILSKVKGVISEYSQHFEPSQINEINKKINKILRIKNSTNLDYILATTEDLLHYLEQQEQTLSQKGYEEKRIQFRLKTQELLRELYSSKRKKTLKDDIVEKIRTWENSAKKETNKTQATQNFFLKFLNQIRKSLETPMEIKAIKEQIKVYNTQLWEFIKLYFKEPTPEYKNKVKQSLKTIWLARKKAQENLKIAKTQLKNKTEKKLTPSFLEQNDLLSELSSLSGWLLAFYLVYYVIALYLSTKNFGLEQIPLQLQVLSSSLFKYLLMIIFLLHISLSLKINFFKRSFLANIFISIFFLTTSAIVIFNL